jgi:Arc/MetJ-type ribon-helix-helix transcriptional regulator
MGRKKVAEEEKFKTVSIPAALFERIEERIKGTDFTSVSGYVKYVLEEILSEGEEKKSFAKEDEEQIKERLRALGYIE